MKKVIIINILALFVASYAFAGTTGAATGTVDFTTPNTGLSLWGAATTVSVTNNVPAAGTILIGKNSTGVGTGWDTSGLGYMICTQHISGSKAFGTSYDSSAIYQIDVAKGVAVTPTAATDSSAFPSASGWTTM
jgi:hypothetical protein